MATGRDAADELLAVALAGGQTHAKAAAAAGISERTVRRRLDDAAFRARVQQIRDGMVSEAAGRLAEAMSAAALVLRKLLGSKDEHVQHKAAVKIVELGLKVTELAELQRRVEELERRATGGPQR